MANTKRNRTGPARRTAGAGPQRTNGRSGSAAAERAPRADVSPAPTIRASAPPPRRPSVSRYSSGRQVWWRSPMALVAAVVVVAVIIAGFAAVALNQGRNGGTSQADLPTVMAAVTQVSPSVSSAVGTGGLPQPLKATPPTAILKGPTQKPELLYIGAGYCPYCAAERWSIIVALSRFGTFSGVQLAQSSGTDIYPNTPTFTFYGSTYHSDYLDFVPVEETGQDEQSRLQAPTAAEQQLFNTYDAAPYTTSPGGIPFIDLANQFITVSSGYSPQVLAGQSWTDIAKALADPKAATTQAIVGNANYLTAALCHVTGNQPAAACTAAPIPELVQQLPTAK